MAQELEITEPISVSGGSEFIDLRSKPTAPRNADTDAPEDPAETGQGSGQGLVQEPSVAEVPMEIQEGAGEHVDEDHSRRREPATTERRVEVPQAAVDGAADRLGGADDSTVHDQEVDPVDKSAEEAERTEWGRQRTWRQQVVANNSCWTWTRRRDEATTVSENEEENASPNVRTRI